MKTIWYAVLNETTGEKTIAGVDSARANKILADLQNENKTDSFKVIYKWRNI